MKHTSIPGPHEGATPELTSDLQPLMSRLQDASEPFALATVVRTISVTAAKAGAKAVISKDGSIAGGWIGGGVRACRRHQGGQGVIGRWRNPADLDPSGRPFVGSRGGSGRGTGRRAVRQKHVPEPGHDGYFRGTGPATPEPRHLRREPGRLRTFARQAPTIGFDVTICAPAEDHPAFPGATRRIENLAPGAIGNADTYVIVSTQGRGDLAALEGALAVPVRHVGFVGSRRKINALKEKLREKGISEPELERIEGPAGLDLGAITPEEIALSILAELLVIRRRGQRQTSTQTI